MKLYKYIALASVALFAAACTEDALDDLSGKYPAPAATTYTAATDNRSEEHTSELQSQR